MAREGKANKRKSGRKETTVKVDMSKVTDGFKAVPEGQYPVSVSAASIEHSDKSNSDYVKFEFEISEGKEKGSKLFHNCSLQPQALFNLKAVMSALGFEIPTKAFDLDINDLVGLECVVDVAHEMYEGKKKSRIVEFINPDESDEEEEDDDEEEVDLTSLDLEQLKELAAELKINASKVKKAKKAKDLIALIEEEDEEDVAEAYSSLFGDEEEDEDEEDDEVDYESMSIDELKAECKERGIKFSKKDKKPELIELLEEDDEE